MKEESIVKRYEALYKDLIESRDSVKMQVLGNAVLWAFTEIADKYPDIARRWLEKLEAATWGNFVSESEAADIVNGFVNQNGVRGPKWQYAKLMPAVQDFGGIIECAPYYNKYALFVTMNMLYSDHAESTSEFVAEDNRLLFYYKQAIEKLKDPDRPHFIRPYFGL